MSRILPDHEIRKLLGSVIEKASEKLLNPNGIELRLGGHVLFQSTGEEKELSDGMFLNILPGESVIITSMEILDFRKATVEAHLPKCMLMGLITPTTTMMREGILQATTKVDSGFHGVLNWGLRNASVKELTLAYGEPIFKLTMFALDGEAEAPEVLYGDRDKDSYQDTQGILRSSRKIPTDIPKSKLVKSSFGQIDPRRQLREAGYPFDHISTELANLHGKFELVSTDVRYMKEEFQKRTNELSEKIAHETSALTAKVDEAKQSVLEKVEHLFNDKFSRIVGILLGSFPLMYAGLSFARGHLSTDAIGFIALLLGTVILTMTVVLARRR
jgi:deoxycytidine triphosphate deaminase